VEVPTTKRPTTQPASLTRLDITSVILYIVIVIGALVLLSLSLLIAFPVAIYKIKVKRNIERNKTAPQFTTQATNSMTDNMDYETIPDGHLYLVDPLSYPNPSYTTTAPPVPVPRGSI